MSRYGWFRLHHEARTDAKLETLPDQQFRVWFRLLCFANEQPVRGTITGYAPKVLAAEVARGDLALLNATLARLEELEMIERDGGAMAFRTWKQRQYDYPSDLPEATRERKAQSRDVTSGHERVTSGHDTQKAESRKQKTDLSPTGSTQGKEIVAVAATAAAAARSSEQDESNLAERVAAGMKWPAGSYDPDDLLAVLRCYPDADADELVKEARKCRQAAPKYHKRADLVWLDNWLRKAFPRQQAAVAAAAAVSDSEPLPIAAETAPEVEPPPSLPAVSLAGYREDVRTWRAVAAELRKTASATRFDTVYGGAKLLLPPKQNAPPDAIPMLVLHSRASLELSDRYTREIAAAFQAAAPHIASLRRVCAAQIVTPDAADEAACISPADGLPPAEPASVIPMAAHRSAARRPSSPKGA